MVWEDGCQSGQYVVYADRAAWNGAINEDKNGADVLLNLSRNALLVNLVLLKVASVGKPRGVGDANVENTLHVVSTLTSANTYHYIVVGRKFVKARGVGPTLVVRTTFEGVVTIIESLPSRTLAMSSKSDGFPTLVSPTIRMVYGAFVLFFRVLVIPCMRDSMLLEVWSINDASKMSLKLA